MNRATMYIYFSLTLFSILLITTPKIFMLFYIYFRMHNKDKLFEIYLDIFDKFFLIYFSYCFSVMLADRPYYIGTEVGFGDDLFHYYNAFSWLIDTSWLDFIKDFSYITALTGSSEPLFWFFIKIISLFFSDPYSIHIILTVVSCILIYYAGQVWGKSGLLFLFLYTNTITFFAFQGSALRSGLAFSFATLGYAFLVKNKYKFFGFLSPLIHFSMLPLPIITYLSVMKPGNYSNKIRSILILIVLSLIFLFVFLRGDSSGLGMKISNRLGESQDLDISSIKQFFVETIFTIILVFFVFKEKVDSYLKKSLVIFFILSIIILLVSPTSFSRFYRYEYIIFLFIYSSIILRSNYLLKYLILLLSLGWFIFIGYNRYVGVFTDDIFEYLNFNMFYIMN